MRLYILILGLLCLVTAESIEDVAKTQGSLMENSGNHAGSSGLNEPEIQMSKKYNSEESQPIVKDKQKKEGAKEETASGEIVYGSYTTHADKNGIPVTIEYFSNPQPGFESKGNSKQPAHIGDRPLVDLNKKDSNLQESTPMLKDEEIEELPALEGKIIHEEGSEQTDPAGVIHGRYTYVLDRDRIPTILEYEATPETGFTVTNFYKQNSGKAEKNSNLKVKLKDNEPLDPKNTKITLDLRTPDYQKAPFEANIPNYEHSTILAKYKPRSRRSDHSSITIMPVLTVKSPPPPGEGLVDPALDPHDREAPAELANIENLDESYPKSDASYKFGFSLDDQSRKEESDSKGNVVGSYSYMDYDGVMTKVEYEAGANKGFVVKKISHEQLEPLKLKEFKSKRKDKKISEDEQSPKTHVGNGKGTEKLSDEGFSNGSPLEGKNIPDSIIRDYEGANLDIGDYSAKDVQEFSKYGLPTGEYAVPPVDLEIRRAIAISEESNKQNNKRTGKIRKVAIKMPRKPNYNNNFMNMKPDGSYEFSYKTNDHSRRESVDPLGNVHSSYQQHTKRDGTTVVVFERRGADNGAINKPTNVKNRYSNRLGRPTPRASLVYENYRDQPHHTAGEPKVPRIRSSKHTDRVADFIMRNSKI